MTAYAIRARQEWLSLALGMRRAAACVAFASACVAAWVIGAWLLGDRFVYDDDVADEPAVAAPSGDEPRLAPRPQMPASSRRGGDYPLDSVSRTASAGRCPEVALTTFAGESIAFEPVARVAAPFQARLMLLEQIVHDVARAFYGRAPSAIRVAASHDCRAVSGNPRRLSEHAFGNAIDITGFRFSADVASGSEAFELSIDRHWNARGATDDERHERFLHALTQALLARDVFRTLLGPAHRDHADHFHFDMAPHPFVNL
jgi:hypothetical protein